MRASAFGLAIASVLLQPASAAETPDHLNQQERKRPDFVAPGPAAGFELPPVAPAPAASTLTGQAVLVNRIGFRGNTVIPVGELDGIAAPFVGRNVDVAEIEELRQKLSRYYIDHGYVNSGALLGRNALEGTTLTFDIVEGRLKIVRLRGLGHLHESYVSERLVRDLSAPFNIDHLRERFQLLLGDPLIDRLNARVIPGTRLGEAILDVDVVRARPYQLRAFAHNHRSPSIGANAVGLSGWVRNLTGYGDVLESTLQDSTTLGDAERGSLSWVMPLNASGTQFSLLLDHGRSSVVQEPMRSLDIKSILDTRDAGLSQTFFENLAHKFAAGVSYVRRENRTSLLGEPFSFVPGEPEGVTRILAWRYWQEYSYRTETQVLALRSTFTSARNNLQLIPGLPAVGNQPEPKYDLWLVQAQYARQMMDNGAQLVVRFGMQQTRHHLLALDQMAIGGAATVRGYRENQLVRDRGAIINVEFEYPLIRNSGAGLNVVLVPFCDIGRGSNLNESSSTMSSAGLATRAQWQGLSLNLALARRLAHSGAIDTSGGTLQDRGVHLELGYKFFGY